MCSQDEFIEKIRTCKLHDKNAMEDIISIFDPLLKHYSYKLNYEDAKQDMTLFLIELIRDIPSAMVSSSNQASYAQLLSYISHSVYHRFILLSKKNDFRLSYETEFPDDLDFLFDEDWTSHSLMNGLLRTEVHKLPDKQQRVILLKYFSGYSDSEISNILSITRQAVNRLKNRAFGALMIQLSDFYK